MKNFFSGLNLLIFIFLFFLSSLLYNQFLKKENHIADNDFLVSHEDVLSQKEIIDNEEKNNPLPDSSTFLSKKIEEEKIIPTGPKTDNGYYENEVYKYSIRVDPSWPLKIRAENNVSFGIIPPKDGQGSITIEVGQGAQKEIEEIKREVKKYPGTMSVSEQNFSIGEEKGRKFIFSNNIIGIKNYYVVLNKNSFDYIIKYSNQSTSFLNEAEKAISTFRFLK
jgi:hypothetical protein